MKGRILYKRAQRRLRRPLIAGNLWRPLNFGNRQTSRFSTLCFPKENPLIDNNALWGLTGSKCTGEDVICQSTGHTAVGEKLGGRSQKRPQVPSFYKAFTGNLWIYTGYQIYHWGKSLQLCSFKPNGESRHMAFGVQNAVTWQEGADWWGRGRQSAWGWEPPWSARHSFHQIRRRNFGRPWDMLKDFSLSGSNSPAWICCNPQDACNSMQGASFACFVGQNWDLAGRLPTQCCHGWRHDPHTCTVSQRGAWEENAVSGELPCIENFEEGHV